MFHSLTLPPYPPPTPSSLFLFEKIEIEREREREIGRDGENEDNELKKETILGRKKRQIALLVCAAPLNQIST